MKILCRMFGHKIGGVVDIVAAGGDMVTLPGPPALYFVVNTPNPPPPQFCCARCGHLWDTTYEEIEEKTDFIGRYP